MEMKIILVLFVVILTSVLSLGLKSVTKYAFKRSSIHMVVDNFYLVDLSPSFLHHSDTLSHSMQYALQGFADALAVTADPSKDISAITCPNFGEPGWGPFCFLNGNPVFKVFDQFQAFVQNSVIGLHDVLASTGLQNAYGPSIVLFTIFVRILLFPVTYQQLASSQKTQALQPKLAEIKEKYPDKNTQNQLIALLYQETNVNPLAGCLPAILQIPVFIALYRSFQNLASTKTLEESFFWIPSLQGPVYGTRSSDWLFKGWHDFTPSLGWHDTLAFMSIPIILVIAQTISLQILSPPSQDPAVQRSQQLLKYLPLMIGYFSLSVPAGLGVYWITNNLLSTLSTISVKQYFKSNPIKLPEINVEELMGAEFAKSVDPVWGYKSREDMLEEARINYFPSRPAFIIPEDFE